MDCREIARAQRSDVFLERAQACRIFFDEVGPGCPPGKGFEAERARAGVKIQHAGVGKLELKDAHPGLTNSIQRRSHAHATRRADSSSAPATGYYPHTEMSAMRACR